MNKFFSFLCIVLSLVLMVSCSNDPEILSSANSSSDFSAYQVPDSSSVIETVNTSESTSTASQTDNGSTTSNNLNIISSSLPSSSSSNTDNNYSHNDGDDYDEYTYEEVFMNSPIVPADNSPASQNITVGGKNYYLTFEDTFDDELNTDIWYTNQGELRQWNCRFDESCAETIDGALRLSIIPDGEGGSIAGGVVTQGTFSQTYGYFEARLLLPTPPFKWWGAWWMMCGNVTYQTGGSKNGVEVDIVETISNRDYTLQHNMHCNYGPNRKDLGEIYRGLKPELGGYNLYKGWHTYGFQWTDDYYIFYIDGKEDYRTQFHGICTEPGYMLLTMEAMEDYAKNGVANCMWVDWVRVYQEEGK